MIQANAAMELCIIKGQEGTVYGWQLGTGSHGQQVIDMLFVKLIDPPQNVHFEGLPENVIPLVRESKKIECFLPDDTSIHI